MAKTVFSNGSDLLPAFTNSIYGTGTTGGHRHDAVDSDGHADKVDLTGGAEVKGELPQIRTVPARNYIDGFKLENATGDATHDIKVNTGACVDSTNAYLLSMMAAALTKQIDAAWAAGDNAGGFPSAGGSGLTLTNSTWYHLFAIFNPSSVSVDAGFDSNLDASVLLNADNAGGAGYTKYRRLGSIYYVGDAIKAFRQFGDEFFFTPHQADYFDTPTADVITTITLSAPSGLELAVDVNIQCDVPSAAYQHLLVYDGINIAGGAARYEFSWNAESASGSNGFSARLRTNTSRQIAIERDTNTGITTVWSVRWFDPRGKE